MGESVIRRAGPQDQALLLELIREFCQIDRHDFDEARVACALPPLLEDDRFGVVWLIGEPTIGTLAAGVPAAGVPAAGGSADQAPVSGYAVVTWSYSLESGGPDALLDEIYLRNRHAGLGSSAVCGACSWRRSATTSRCDVSMPGWVLSRKTRSGCCGQPIETRNRQGPGGGPLQQRTNARLKPRLRPMESDRGSLIKPLLHGDAVGARLAYRESFLAPAIAVEQLAALVIDVSDVGGDAPGPGVQAKPGIPGVEILLYPGRRCEDDRFQALQRVN